MRLGICLLCWILTMPPCPPPACPCCHARLLPARAADATPTQTPEPAAVPVRVRAYKHAHACIHTRVNTHAHARLLSPHVHTHTYTLSHTLITFTLKYVHTKNAHQCQLYAFASRLSVAHTHWASAHWANVHAHVHPVTRLLHITAFAEQPMRERWLPSHLIALHIRLGGLTGTHNHVHLPLFALRSARGAHPIPRIYPSTLIRLHSGPPADAPPPQPPDPDEEEEGFGF